MVTPEAGSPSIQRIFADRGFDYGLAVTRRLGVLAILGLAIGLGACAEDGEELTSEQEIRECLSSAGVTLRQPGVPNSWTAGYASIYLPDFTAATAGGTDVGILVVGSEQKASRTASHVRSALVSFGAGQGRSSVISAGNAVAVFASKPSAPDTEAVRGCLEG
jgi:hypothetical protein